MGEKYSEEFKTSFASLAKSDRKALAELIVEYIDPNHISTDIIGTFLNTRTLKPGDALDWLGLCKVIYTENSTRNGETPKWTIPC